MRLPPNRVAVLLLSLSTLPFFDLVARFEIFVIHTVLELKSL